MHLKLHSGLFVVCFLTGDNAQYPQPLKYSILQGLQPLSLNRWIKNNRNERLDGWLDGYMEEMNACMNELKTASSSDLSLWNEKMTEGKAIYSYGMRGQLWHTPQKVMAT